MNRIYNNLSAKFAIVMIMPILAACAPDTTLIVLITKLRLIVRESRNPISKRVTV